MGEEEDEPRQHAMDECSDDDDNYELSMRERDMETLQQGHKNVGFKDGRDAGRNEAIQHGVEQGWPSGLAVGLLFGHLLGWLSVLTEDVSRWYLPRSVQSC